MRKRTEFGWMELILGIILTILGIFTMIRPESMLNSIVICYGIVAAVSGITDIIFYVKMERHMGVVPTVSLTSGILSTLLGMMLILCPGAAQRLVIWLFALWIIMHSISRLSHISTVRCIPVVKYRRYRDRSYASDRTDYSSCRIWLSDRTVSDRAWN